MIICLETSTNLCSVALCDSGGLISLRESDDSKSHASKLTVFINEILKESGLKTRDLGAIAVSKGPGSYTGLRIGVSVAKGIAYASSIPLIGIDTPYSMFWGIIKGEDEKKREDNEKSLYCPMLDARRMEVYYALYDHSGSIVKEIAADVIKEDSFIDIDINRTIIFFGDGAAKCKEVIKRPNIYFDVNFRISAAHMFAPAIQALNDRHFESVAYFEPFYLKDFITSIPRKNILGK
jgi:tRNA threonylcarbamoyladenosine biosynthesis protein TsaB